MAFKLPTNPRSTHLGSRNLHTAKKYFSSKETSIEGNILRSNYFFSDLSFVRSNASGHSSTCIRPSVAFLATIPAAFGLLIVVLQFTGCLACTSLEPVNECLPSSCPRAHAPVR